MKIVQLIVQDFKGDRRIVIKPTSPLVRIAGKNGQGKSSLLDSIQYGLSKGGSNRTVRRGAKKSKVTIDLGDFVVTKSCTANGKPSLKVTTATGDAVASPQAFLDGLVGDEPVAFDPLEFSRRNPADQATVLRELAGLNMDEFDDLRAKAYDERKAVNREVKQLEAEYRACPHHPDAPAEPVSVADLTAELKAIEEHNATRDAKMRELEAARANVVDMNRRSAEKLTEIEALRKRIAELESGHAELVTEIGKAVDAGTKLRAEVDAIPFRDSADTMAKLEDSQETNAKVSANVKRAELLDKLTRKQGESESLTEKIEEIDAAVAKAIAEAKYPVDGISIDGDVVLFNGVPLADCATSERTRVSTAIGMALNPELRIMLIRDGSLLDEESLAAYEAMIADEDYQVWIELVGDGGGGENCFVIEDGSLVDEEGEAAQ